MRALAHSRQSKMSASHEIQIDEGYSLKAAREIAEVRSTYEAKLQNVEVRVREELERNFKDKRSAFYKELENEIKSNLSRETATRDSQLASSKTDLEKKFNIDYEAKFLAMQGAFDDKFGDMVNDFEQSMGQARDAWEGRWREQLDDNSQSWAAKWATREREWLEKEQQRERSRAMQEEQHQEQYRTLLEGHMAKVDSLLEEQGAADLALLDTRIKELEQSKTELAASSERIDEEVHKKYGEWVARLNESHEESLAALQRTTARNEATLQKALQHEREVHATTCTMMQQEHRRQLEQVQATIREERKDMARAQQVFEETLRVKYESMVDTLQEKVRTEQEAQMRRALDLLEKAARAESERSRQMYEVQSKAEAAAAAKFQDLVTELRQTWEMEESTRSKQLDQRLRNHYETVIAHMQSQLDAALKLNDDADKKWMEDVEARNRQQVATMQAYEEKCRRLYQTRLTEYIERTDAELAEYEEMLLTAGSKAAVQKARFESHIRRVKLSCAKWRADYQKEIEARYEQTVEEMDRRYMTEVSSLLQQLSEANAKLTNMDEKVQGLHERSAHELNKAKMAEMDARQRSQNAVKLVARQRELHNTLLKLWSGLKTPPGEQVHILEQLVAVSEPSEEMIQAYTRYNEQLSAQLPLIQMATRREYLKFRVKALRRAASGEHGKTRSDALFDTLHVSSFEQLEEEFEASSRELANLTNGLKRSVAAYNDRFQKRFEFNGNDYLQCIFEDNRAEQALSTIDQKLKMLEEAELAVRQGPEDAGQQGPDEEAF